MLYMYVTAYMKT